MFKNLVWFDYHAATGPSVFLGVDVHVQDRGRGAEGGGLGEEGMTTTIFFYKFIYTTQHINTSYDKSSQSTVHIKL